MTVYNDLQLFGIKRLLNEYVTVITSKNLSFTNLLPYDLYNILIIKNKHLYK